MHIVITILFVISFFMNIIWLRFIWDYAKDWPNLKDDFDKHMTEIYEKIKQNNE